MMTSFYYYDQNPSGICFLVQIRAFVIETSLRTGITKLKYERKNEKDSGGSSKIQKCARRCASRDSTNQ